MKLRNDSTLANLTEPQQAQLYDWLVTLGYSETIRKVEQPPPDGFGLKTYRATLHGFYKRYAAVLRSRDIAAAKENRSDPRDGSVLVSDAEQSFHYAGHQLATGPMDSEDFARVSHWLEWQKSNEIKLQYRDLAERQLALNEKRHALEREKFETGTARLALEHAAALQRIYADSSLDISEKVRAARDELYGPGREKSMVCTL